MSKNVKAEFLRDGRIRLIRPFGEVPRNFVCDGASIPRFFWRIFGHPFDRRHIRGGVKHDWGYAVGGDARRRRLLDAEYRRDIRTDGQSLVLAWIEWLVVRLCGRSHFKNK